MRPVLLLIDLQNDFLGSPQLQPAAGRVVRQAARLLGVCRRLAIPVAHAWTTVRRGADDRMPHWKRSGTWRCVEGTEGHSPPPVLQPTGSEPVVHKTCFSAFSSRALDPLLARLGADTLILAGVHLHGCIRATALDAYQRRLRVLVAEDAVGSHDPLHAAMTRRYLAARAAEFLLVEHLAQKLQSGADPPVAEELGGVAVPATIVGHEPRPDSALQGIVHRSPRAPRQMAWRIPCCREQEVAAATAAAAAAWPAWTKAPPSARAAVLRQLADRLQADAQPLADRIVQSVGKPLVYARQEVVRAAEVLRAVAGRAEEAKGNSPCLTAGATFRHRAVGAIALITPWNHPLGIPLGKIAPALLYGNVLVWKPAPAGSSIAVAVMEHLRAAGCPPGVVNLVCGDRWTAELLMGDAAVDAVTLTGSLAAGYVAQEICAGRHVPLQAELGGNNAAIVCSDADLDEAARQVAEGAFGMAGQRCTANRRVIVEDRAYQPFLDRLVPAAAALGWGDPLDESIRVGPLISAEHCQEVADLVARARPEVEAVLSPRQSSPGCNDLLRIGTYYPPTIVCCRDPGHEVVQEETFGPVLVVQQASDFSQALELCNGVKQGLVAALFSGRRDIQQEFLLQARAGVLKINRATADVDLALPLGGWKASGIGPAEHGESDREFYTRTQAIYVS